MRILATFFERVSSNEILCARSILYDFTVTYVVISSIQVFSFFGIPLVIEHLQM